MFCEAQNSRTRIGASPDSIPRESPEVKDIAVVPFACRSLTFDGERFWANHRAADEIVSFRLPHIGQ